MKSVFVDLSVTRIGLGFFRLGRGAALGHKPRAEVA